MYSKQPHPNLFHPLSYIYFSSFFLQQCPPFFSSFSFHFSELIKQLILSSITQKTYLVGLQFKIRSSNCLKRKKMTVKFSTNQFDSTVLQRTGKSTVFQTHSALRFTPLQNTLKLNIRIHHIVQSLRIGSLQMNISWLEDFCPLADLHCQRSFDTVHVHQRHKHLLTVPDFQ